MKNSKNKKIFISGIRLLLSIAIIWSRNLLDTVIYNNIKEFTEDFICLEHGFSRFHIDIKRCILSIKIDYQNTSQEFIIHPGEDDKILTLDYYIRRCRLLSPSGYRINFEIDYDPTRKINLSPQKLPVKLLDILQQENRIYKFSVTNNINELPKFNLETVNCQIVDNLYILYIQINEHNCVCLHYKQIDINSFLERNLKNIDFPGLWEYKISVHSFISFLSNLLVINNNHKFIRESAKYIRKGKGELYDSFEIFIKKYKASLQTMYNCISTYTNAKILDGKKILDFLETFVDYAHIQHFEYYTLLNGRELRKIFESEEEYIKMFNALLSKELYFRDFENKKYIRKFEVYEVNPLENFKLQIDYLKKAFFCNITSGNEEVHMMLCIIPDEVFNIIIERLLTNCNNVNMYIFLDFLLKLSKIDNQEHSELLKMFFYGKSVNIEDNHIIRKIKALTRYDLFSMQYKHNERKVCFFLYKILTEEYIDSKQKEHRNVWFRIFDYLEIPCYRFNVMNIFSKLFVDEIDKKGVGNETFELVEYFKTKILKEFGRAIND